MLADTVSLVKVYEGWEGYQQSLVDAVRPLTSEQLAYRPAPHLRSVGQIAAHISAGRVGWFARMGAPGSRELLGESGGWEDGPLAGKTAREFVSGLEASWRMIEQTLKEWTVADLSKTYRHSYQGTTYAISRQWTIWRIMAHDLHHGGELAVMLGLQGIAIPELGDFGGHITEPPLAEEGAR